MSSAIINTVTGPIPVDQLGVTLMHEHVLIGMPGWQADSLRPGRSRDEIIPAAVEKIRSMQALGIQSMVDPCPNDLGRDVELAAEISARTGFNIVCATGLYKEAEGGHAYWHLPRMLGFGVDAMAELFIHELTEGIGKTNIKAGIIKVATGVGTITDYEYDVLTAAARASIETGAPITTHTDEGTMGDKQQAFLVEQGVPAHKIIIGHSCGSTNHDYHLNILDKGSYLGFDRFGMNFEVNDDQRVEALAALLLKQKEERIVVSHDCVWCMRGDALTEKMIDEMGVLMDPTHFHRNIVPQLLERGVTQAQIDTMLTDNPRRYFAGEN